MVEGSVLGRPRGGSWADPRWRNAYGCWAWMPTGPGVGWHCNHCGSTWMSTTQAQTQAQYLALNEHSISQMWPIIAHLFPFGNILLILLGFPLLQGIWFYSRQPRLRTKADAPR